MWVPKKKEKWQKCVCVGAVVVMTEMRMLRLGDNFLSRKSCRDWSGSAAGVDLLTKVWCVKSVPCNTAKPKLTHVVNKNLKVLYSSFLECFPLQYKSIIVFILNSIMGTLLWIHENYGLWNVTFILRFLRELLVAFHFWPLHEVCSWPGTYSRHQRFFVVSKISMFWMPWDGINMSHVKWLVAPCWFIKQINTWCFYSLKSEL